MTAPAGTPPRPPVGHRVRAVTADLRPLRSSRAFRRLWCGQLLSGVGTQMTVFAATLQVFRATGSSAAVGAIGLVVGTAGVVAGLLAGGVIDAVDRRRLVLLVSSLQLVTSGALAAQAFAGGVLALVFALVGLQAGLGAVSAPARRSFVPQLLPADQLAAGAALQTLVGRSALVAGPALAGVLTGAGGLRFCYVVDAVSFTATIWAALGLPRPAAAGAAPDRGLRAIAEGLRFVRRTRVLVGVYLADISATVLAVPVALFPAVAAGRFGGSPEALGLMSTAMAGGGLTGSVLSGPVSRVQRQGRGMLAAVAVWGLAVTGFGLARGLAPTLLALFVADAADVSSVMLRAAVVQSATPDRLLGRVSATDFVVGGSVPQLGNFRAGVVAQATSPVVSAVSGGLAATAAAGLLALTCPVLRRYRAAVDGVAR